MKPFFYRWYRGHLIRKTSYRSQDGTYAYTVGSVACKSFEEAEAYIDVTEKDSEYPVFSVYDFLKNDKTGTVSHNPVKGKFDWIINNNFKDE